MFLSLPRFACADLREADFTGNPIFTFVENSLETHDGNQPNLAGTQLKDAKFDTLKVHVVSSDAAGTPLELTGGGGSGVGDVLFSTDDVARDVALKIPGSDLAFSISLQAVSRQLRGSDWQNARWPLSLRNWLTSHPPPDKTDKDDCIQQRDY